MKLPHKPRNGKPRQGRYEAMEGLRNKSHSQLEQVSLNPLRRERLHWDTTSKADLQPQTGDHCITVPSSSARTPRNSMSIIFVRHHTTRAGLQGLHASASRARKGYQSTSSSPSYPLEDRWTCPMVKISILNPREAEDTHGRNPIQEGRARLAKLV